jgi:hypothetical protein
LSHPTVAVVGTGFARDGIKVNHSDARRWDAFADHGAEVDLRQKRGQIIGRECALIWLIQSKQ